MISVLYFLFLPSRYIEYALYKLLPERYNSLTPFLAMLLNIILAASAIVLLVIFVGRAARTRNNREKSEHHFLR